MGKEKYRILLVDDHPIIHDGLKNLLAKEKDLSIVAGAYCASKAMELLNTQKIDLAIVDLSLGDADGTYLIQRMHATYPKLKIVVYSMSEEKLFAERTAAAGGSGYVMKTSSPSSLKSALREVLAGGLYFSPTIKANIEKLQIGRGNRQQTPLDTLSNREMDVFKLLGEGLDSVEIGNRLNISRNTVDTHRINIKNKLDMPSGKALVRYAYDVIKQNELPS